MKDNIRRIGSRVYYSESARELGVARFVLGGVILFFGLFFIWIELYIVGVPIVLFAILFMEHCSETIIDKENKVMIKKSGWIKPFITRKKHSLEDVVSLSIETFKTTRRTSGQVIRRTTISYKLVFETSGKQIHIETFTEKTQANTLANEIAKLLEIEFSGTKKTSKK